MSNATAAWSSLASIHQALRSLCGSAAMKQKKCDERVWLKEQRMLCYVPILTFAFCRQDGASVFWTA